MPFFLIVVIVGGLFYVFKQLGGNFQSDSVDLTTETVSLNIEQGSVKAMAVGSSEWQNAPDGIDFYKGEKIKTGFDGRATLTAFDHNILRVGNDSEIELSKLTKKNETNQVKVHLEEGELWVQVDRISNPNSFFRLTTDLLAVDIRSGTLAISAPGTVYMIEGIAEIDILDNDDVLTTKTLGVGQQLSIDEEVVSKLTEGLDETLVYALSDGFKSSEWYRWNMKKDGSISAFEKSDLDDEIELDELPDVIPTVDPDSSVTVISPKNGLATNKSTIAISGTYDSDSVQNVYVQGKKASLNADDTWKVYEFSLTREGKNELTLEAEDLSGTKTTLDSITVHYDNIPPTTPQITSPIGNDESFTIADIEQEILGTVDKDTYAVIINDYQLSKFVSGSKEFSYFAKTAYGNLEVGENEYLIYAKDKAGNLSDVATLTLVLEQDTVDTAGVGDEDEDELDVDADTDTTDESEEDAVEQELPTSSSTGGVEITSPNGGESFKTSETQFEINGTVPEGTASVEVDDYKLQAFSKGDTEYKYRASSSMGNLTIGAKNTYTVNAYDDSGEVVGTASITIDVESGSMGDPTINIPSSNPYETTLNEIVIGGTVGKWVEKIYVNGEKLQSYIPGSEKWRSTVELVLGENIFNIYGEKQGDNTKTVSLTVIYKP